MTYSNIILFSIKNFNEILFIEAFNTYIKESCIFSKYFLL